MRQQLWIALSAVLGTALLAACTSASPGRAEPAPAGTTSAEPTASSSAAPTSTELPSDGAPKVTNPLDTSRFQADPCPALTPAQAQELNLGSPGSPKKGPLGNACEWRNSETAGLAQLLFLDRNPRGLSATYKANKDGKFAFFEELPDIEGHPAVASGLNDERQGGRCIVTVGVTDKLTFDLGLSLSRANVGQKDPCAVAAQVAGMALRTMKAGG